MEIHLPIAINLWLLGSGQQGNKIALIYIYLHAYCRYVCYSVLSCGVCVYVKGCRGYVSMDLESTTRNNDEERASGSD